MHHHEPVVEPTLKPGKAAPGFSSPGSGGPPDRLKDSAARIAVIDIGVDGRALDIEKRSAPRPTAATSSPS